MTEGQQEGSAPSSETKTALAGGASQMGGGQEASVGFVTQTYTNYVNELQTVVEGLRQRATSLQTEGPAQIQQLQSQIQPSTIELVETLQDTKTSVSVPTANVIEMFGWSSIMLFATAIGSIVGGYLLSPVLGIFLGRFGSALFAFAGIPAFAYVALKEKDGNNSDMRFQLLAIAAVQGILMGHATANTYIAGQPILFVAPLATAFAYPLVAAQVGNAHVQLLGGAVGASFAINLILGLVLGSFSAPFFILNVLYSAASGAVLQVAFKNLKEAKKVHLYQIALVSSFLFAKGLVFALFGSSEPIQNSSPSTE